jgi:glycosyltransferase involved in cell wall biosynthesis
MLLSNPATFDQRPLKEAHSLAKAGYSVTILAWDRELETGSDSRFDDGVVIKRMRLGAGHGTPFYTVPKLLVFYVWCLAHLLGPRWDAVHCHDVDTLPVGLAARALKLRRPRLVYDMHDLPEAFLRFFPLLRLTQKVALAFAKGTADLVVVVNDRFVKYLGRLGFAGSKLVVVMNASPSSKGRRPKRRGDELKVLYYGTLSQERGVALLLQSVKGLQGVSLELAGRGPLESWVLSEARQNPKVVFLGWLGMPQLEEATLRSDVIASLYEPRTRNAVLATPGKLLNAMSVSLPTLVPSGTYQAEIVQRYGCGEVVEWGDVESVRRALLKLSGDRKLYDRMAAAAFDAFQSAFSWEVMEARLSEAYGRLLS